MTIYSSIEDNAAKPLFIIFKKMNVTKKTKNNKQRNLSLLPPPSEILSKADEMEIVNQLLVSIFNRNIYD